MNSLVALGLVLAMVSLALTADYFLKLAGQKDQFLNRDFFLGMTLYASTAFVWLFVLKYVKFSVANLFYSLFTIILAVLIGVFRFKESLNLLEMAGIGMAFISIILLGRFI